MTDRTPRLNEVLDRIARAAVRAGRPVPGLVAVSKRHDAAAVVEVARQWRERCARMDMACTGVAFGENYVREGAAKRVEVDAALPVPATWHLIGHLQRNKAREAASAFDWVQSVDRVAIAEALARHRPAAAGPLQVLVQVNIDADAGKDGCAPGDVDALCDAVAAMPALALRGLMAIGRAHDDPADARPALRAMRVLFEGVQSRHRGVDTLSMGMSDDLEVAIEEGATLVRVGTAIFGAREVIP